MTEKEKKFVASWSKNIAEGKTKYVLKNTAITCLFSAAVVLIYTWKNIPENKLIQSLLPLSILIFGMGIPLGIIFSFNFWVRNNNKYKFLTTNNPTYLPYKKKKWRGHDKIWDFIISALGAFNFLLLYTSIFLFDSGRPTALKYSIVGINLSYFAVLIGYYIYRYIADKSGETKIFPIYFKYIFSTIILLTILFWLILFNGPL